MSQFYRELNNQPEGEPQNQPEAADELHDPIARLSASAESEEMQQRISLLEQWLRTTPLVAPAADFAERVVEAIRQRKLEPFNHNMATGIILGLSTAALLMLGLLIALVIAIVLIILNWTDTYQTLILAAGAVESTAVTIREAFNEGFAASPLMTALSVLSVPLFFVWMWLMRRLTPLEA